MNCHCFQLVLVRHSLFFYSCAHTFTQGILCIQFLQLWETLLTYVSHSSLRSLWVFASPRIAHISACTQSSGEKNHPFLLLTTVFACFSNPAHTRNSTTQCNRRENGNYFPLSSQSVASLPPVTPICSTPTTLIPPLPVPDQKLWQRQQTLACWLSSFRSTSLWLQRKKGTYCRFFFFFVIHMAPTHSHVKEVNVCIWASKRVHLEPSNPRLIWVSKKKGMSIAIQSPWQLYRTVRKLKTKINIFLLNDDPFWWDTYAGNQRHEIKKKKKNNNKQSSRACVLLVMDVLATN